MKEIGGGKPGEPAHSGATLAERLKYYLIWRVLGTVSHPGGKILLKTPAGVVLGQV